jgi:hypothetical protein
LDKKAKEEDHQKLENGKEMNNIKNFDVYSKIKPFNLNHIKSLTVRPKTSKLA